MAVRLVLMMGILLAGCSSGPPTIRLPPPSAQPPRIGYQIDRPIPPLQQRQPLMLAVGDERINTDILQHPRSPQAQRDSIFASPGGSPDVLLAQAMRRALPMHGYDVVESGSVMLLMRIVRFAIVYPPDVASGRVPVCTVELTADVVGRKGNASATRSGRIWIQTPGDPTRAQLETGFSSALTQAIERLLSDPALLEAIDANCSSPSPDAAATNSSVRPRDTATTGGPPD